MRDRALMRRARNLLIVTVVAMLASLGVAVAATSGPQPLTYLVSPHALEIGVRPTAVGLPEIAESGTVGAGELAASLEQYYSSGMYERDLATVDGLAQRTLAEALRVKSGKVSTGTGDCPATFKPVKVGHRTLYKRVPHCAKRPKLQPGKLAIVLDIDETSLSNYADLASSGFTAAGVTESVVSGAHVPIKPTLALYKYARAHHVAVFFITGRPAAIDSITTKELKEAGYSGWNGLYEKPVADTTEAFKSATRAMLQHKGYDIIENVGDQESDLAGGHADASFKLPDPFYFIADR